MIACLSPPPASVAPAAAAPGDVKLSDRTYVRHDGGTDATLADCAVDNRQRNEQFGNRDRVLFDDYNYIAASGTAALMTWTHQRDTIPRTAPRHTGDGTDGFDVPQCRAPGGPDTCPNAGGVDQNIYGKVSP
ncbi:hypothetical protein [Actinokineospora xionganensis]|uniref:Secreted protein n=1 Tax=Actinokineospora xionganensis TaxID=2684470 RepID=A0ABR7L6H8_9PSEU|nr:hypothetical protein [Actinokineospora xionganensis]MBC6447981.1 hypothetical protein [Actinokineospora xionganensis]